MAGVVRGHDDQIGPARHRGPHQGALAAVAIPAAAEQGRDPGPGEAGADGAEDGLQGVRGVGEVDDDGAVAAGPAVEAAVHRLQVPPVRALAGAQDAIGQGPGQGVVRPVVLQGQEGLGGDGLGGQVGGDKHLDGDPRLAGPAQAPGHLRAAAVKSPAGLDQVEDARLGRKVGRLVVVIVQVVLGEVGPAGILQGDAVGPPLVQGMAADLHGHHIAAPLLGVQQPAQFDLGRGGKARLHHRLAVQGDPQGADGQHPPPVGREHGLQVLDGGRLAVGPGDADEGQARLQGIDQVTEAPHHSGPVAGAGDIDPFARQGVETVEHAVGDQHREGAACQIAAVDLGVALAVVKALEEQDRPGAAGIGAPLDVGEGGLGRRLPAPGEIQGGEGLREGAGGHGGVGPGYRLGLWLLCSGGLTAACMRPGMD